MCLPIVVGSKWLVLGRGGRVSVGAVGACMVASARLGGASISQKAYAMGYGRPVTCSLEAWEALEMWDLLDVGGICGMMHGWASRLWWGKSRCQP